MSSLSSSPTNSTSNTPSRSSAPKLQTLNCVNVLAYLSNVAVVFGSARAGLPDNGTLSAKYQTLVTPSGYAFSIWGIIFTAELVWTIAQVLPSYRSHELVVQGVGYRFALASFAQCLWTILFGLEKIGLSMIAMIGILVPLLSIVRKTGTTTTSSSSSSSTNTSDYWLLKFPFELHASWIIAATLVNANVVTVAYEASPNVQIATGWLSLVILWDVGIYTATMVPKPRNRGIVKVVPCVLVWASLAIASELSSPHDTIVATFSEATIRHTKIVSTTIAVLLVLVMVVRVVRSWFFKDPTIHDDDDDDNNKVLVSHDDGNESEGDGGGQYSALH